jgi:Ser-tRNA(Ala) deacylase AlaX
MNSTEKLYWADAHATSFETRGAVPGTHGGKPSVVLAQTMFYPEGGGQLGDLGTLALGGRVLRVSDTQVEDGIIHHLIEGELPDGLGADLDVSGSIDALRRRDHMVQRSPMPRVRPPSPRGWGRRRARSTSVVPASPTRISIARRISSTPSS